MGMHPIKGDSVHTEGLKCVRRPSQVIAAGVTVDGSLGSMLRR